MTGRAVCVSAAVVVLLAGCGVHRSVAHDGASTSDPDRAAVMKAARKVQATVHGKFLVATYRPNAGERGPSNTGHRCSGRTMQVRLLWNGASFNHGASTGEDAGDQHQALVITADAEDPHLLAGPGQDLIQWPLTVQIGPARPGSGEL
jgi:hypothetical protein